MPARTVSSRGLSIGRRPENPVLRPAIFVKLMPRAAEARYGPVLADEHRLPAKSTAGEYMRKRNDLFHREDVRWGKETTYTVIGLVVTTTAAVLLYAGIWDHLRQAVSAGRTLPLLEQLLFATVVGGLIYGNLVYQVCRMGYFRRLRSHRPEARETLNRLFVSEAPSLTILVPSYKEEERVILQSLWSAALQEYPGKRVVLLIDDPPQPGSPEDRAGLESARRLPGLLAEALREPAERVAREREAFLARIERSGLDLDGEQHRLAELLRSLRTWFEDQAAARPILDHTDELFLQMTFAEPARELYRRARELTGLDGPDRGTLDREALSAEYARLAARFDATLSSFERKRYANLSHEPNKAMNLNSYIGLIGERLREVREESGLRLVTCTDGEPDLVVPDSDYLITLDADSLLASDYALRLVHLMESPGNEKIAVSQTPYTAYPGAPGLLERVAGATTDIQYLIHQGFTLHGGTYWVGANALLRMTALREISEKRIENGVEVTCFIADRTVIEDTESSVDMAARGWQLYNYPERLSYSATPDDFGALLVQRRRWANGGLIILPKLLRYLAAGPKRLARLAEAFVRVHYLTSLALVNIGVPVLLAFPFEDYLRNAWLPLTALPYFFFYGRDLVQAGYRWRDLPRVYALNLMLIPVNLAGVLKSIHQGYTGLRIPFKRTPKVQGVTCAPPLYLYLEIAMPLYCFLGVVFDLADERWLHALFALANGTFLLYALFRFVLPSQWPALAGRAETEPSVPLPWPAGGPRGG